MHIQFSFRQTSTVPHDCRSSLMFRKVQVFTSVHAVFS